MKSCFSRLPTGLPVLELRTTTGTETRLTLDWKVMGASFEATSVGLCAAAVGGTAPGTGNGGGVWRGGEGRQKREDAEGFRLHLASIDCIEK